MLMKEIWSKYILCTIYCAYQSNKILYEVIMPIPKPKYNESRQNFIERCMGDSTMVDEYNSNQRLAVCNSSYNSNKEDSLDSKEELREDVYTTEEEAEARAEEIGCVGTHSLDENGNKVFVHIYYLTTSCSVS